MNERAICVARWNRSECTLLKPSIIVELRRLMKKQIALLIILAAAAVPVLMAGTVELEPKEMAPPPTITDNDHWYFNIGFPGWLAFVSGDIGLHGTTSHVDVGFDQLITPDA